MTSFGLKNSENTDDCAEEFSCEKMLIIIEEEKDDDHNLNSKKLGDNV